MEDSAADVGTGAGATVVGASCGARRWGTGLHASFEVHAAPWLSALQSGAVSGALARAACEGLSSLACCALLLEETFLPKQLPKQDTIKHQVGACRIE